MNVLVCLCAVLAVARRAVPRPEARTEVMSDPSPPETTENQSEASAVHRRFPFAVLFGATCGGSVIGERWVLTAAHCTIFSTADYVVAGTGRTYDESGLQRPVKRLIVHPHFTVGPYWLNANEFNITQVGAHWDFLLAELEEPLPLDGTSIAAVPLDDECCLAEGMPVAYAGYGAKNLGDSIFEPLASLVVNHRILSLARVSNEHSQETMRSEMHGMELQIVADDACARLEQFKAEDMFCAKGRAPRFDSACNGDSGSGLVADGGGPRRLLGVASWVQDDARECGPGKLVVFSRVAAVRAWIKQVTGI